MTATITHHNTVLGDAMNENVLTTKGINTLSDLHQPLHTSAGPYTVKFAQTLEEVLEIY